MVPKRSREGTPISERAHSGNRFYISLFGIYVTTALVIGAFFELSTLLDRQELQVINKLFETRMFFNWHPESLKRLNPSELWDYHEKHEIPKAWWAWDYTLSWLLEHNHPPVMNHIVIFNRSPEDEPPDEAVEHFAWMRPLSEYPLGRKTMAQMVDFVASAGAKMIILDCDFPQHAPGDKDMADCIHKWSTVGVNGRKVPILMVRAVNINRSAQYLQLAAHTKPVGILHELGKLEPDVDLEAKYLGHTCVDMDTDQVVRRIYLNRYTPGFLYESIVMKAMRLLGQPVNEKLSDPMDIDFISKPRSDLYPVRPWSYLLDPEGRQLLANPAAGTGDVNVKDAIVLVGDGMTDVYSTPMSNEGESPMSGTEILAQALDTLSRKSSPHRLENMRALPPSYDSLLYLLVIASIGGLTWAGWKYVSQSFASAVKQIERFRVRRLMADLIVFVLMLAGSFFISCFVFAKWGVIAPMFGPSLALLFGTLAAILWEREQEREEAFAAKLKAAEDMLALQEGKHEAEVKVLEAESKSREIIIDRKRRHEFVRRINHDLNAPVSVINWIISELQLMDIADAKVKEKIGRLMRSSDKLCELIDQLVQSYDYEIVPQHATAPQVVCDLTSILDEAVDGQKPLAEMNADKIKWDKPEEPHWVKGSELELVRVVDNVIRNAIKHNPNGTKVGVDIQKSGRFHRISISDNGKGIPAEHLDKIFQPGYRVEPEEKTGQGLGLDIAKTLIEQMGGEIEVESTIKEGTTFRLKLPACAATGESGEFQSLNPADYADSPALAKLAALSQNEKPGSNGSDNHGYDATGNGEASGSAGQSPTRTIGQADQAGDGNADDDRENSGDGAKGMASTTAK